MVLIRKWSTINTFLALVPDILKAHLNLFQKLKMKPITQIHVSAADIEEVIKWFKEFTNWCEEHKIKAEYILNFDEVGFQVGVTLSKYIIIPAYVKEVSIILIFNILIINIL